MLLSIRFQDGNSELVTNLLRGEEEQQEEFWFGRGLAWTSSGPDGAAVRLSLVVDVPQIVSRTKRRDREDRFAVGYCDSYPYNGSGLMSVFLSRLRLPDRAGSARQKISIELASYPQGVHAEPIAQRLLAPLGYAVRACGRKLQFEGVRGAKEALRELPAILLTLDRRTRLFLSEEELADVAGNETGWVSSHPAARALELSLAGRPAPLRNLLPPGSPFLQDAAEPEKACELLAQGVIETGGGVSFKVDAAQRKHALRAFSRMNIDPRWLLYLPAPVASAQGENGDGGLEHPASALRYFFLENVAKAVVEEKHMGSRGVVVLCRTLAAARNRFGVDSELPGCAYTRNGRRFFREEDTEAVFLERLEKVLSAAGFWKRFSTDWVCLDGEILPWAVKASEFSEESDLVEAGSVALGEALTALDRGPQSALIAEWKLRLESEREALGKYDSMFKRYRSEEVNLAALKFAPFHLLAVEGQTFFDRSHLWHMQTLGRLARSGNGFLIPTRHEVVSPNDPPSWGKCMRWWDELSASFDEGLVVKPLPFIPRGRRGFAQPALKCRSREHLRLVYGPRYDSEEAHEVLISREALKSRRNKHRRILRQFALSMEGVTRFVQRNPIDAVHECVLGVLAQEVPPMTLRK